MSTYKEYRLPKCTSFSDLTQSTVNIDSVQLKSNEVRVKIHAVSLNFRDLLIIRSLYPIGIKDNVVPCSDGAGEVVAVGDSVQEFKVGDRVMGIFNQEHIDGASTDKSASSSLGGALDGVLTQYKVFPEHGLVHVPSHLSYEEASTLPCAAVTAWNSLYGGEGRSLLPGQTVLLQGTGGVSIFGLQIAAAAGARIIVTSSSDEKLEHAKRLGATHTINYTRTPDWDKEVMKITNGQGADHILEVGGPGTFTRSLQCIRRGGVISCIGFVAAPPSGEEASFVGLLIGREAVIRGIYVGSRRNFVDLNKAIEASSIRPVVDKVFPFDKAQEAFEYLNSQKHVGKVVIKTTTDQ